MLWQTSSPRSKETKPQRGRPSLKVTQKAIGAYFQESQRAAGNKDSIFKGHTKLHTPRTQGIKSNLKGVWVREARDNRGSP